MPTPAMTVARSPTASLTARRMSPIARSSPGRRVAAHGRCDRGGLRSDLSCSFPGCPRLAWDSENDHLLPWPQGRTTTWNIDCKCKHHHQAKTHGGYRVTQPELGTYLWTTPHGLQRLVDDLRIAVRRGRLGRDPGGRRVGRVDGRLELLLCAQQKGLI